MIESKIDFQQIRSLLNTLCHSELGREHVADMSFLTDFAQVTHLLTLAAEQQRLFHDAEVDFPRGDIYDIREAVARVRIDGLYLDESEFFALRRSIDYAAQLESFYRHLDAVRYPTLAAMQIDDTEAYAPLSQLVQAIDRVIDKFGKMRDTASPELARIRHELVKAQGSVARVIDQILRRAQDAGYVDKDSAPTMREGRLVLPVPPAYKRKIGGIVHDESATGKTVFVEPQEVVEANNHIRSLEGEEQRERLRILQELTAVTRPFLPQVLASQVFLGEVDFLCAKAQLGDRLKAIYPETLDEPRLDLHNARHPVLYMRFAEQHKEVVPLNLSLRNGNRVLVISGPNAGGKSVCLKTVALVQYMLQCGLLVPVEESSKMGFFDRILIDIGDEQSIEDDLSTYSSHLRNMKEFVRSVDEKTLFLIDEFGSGTEPLIGGAIAESVLTRLCAQKGMGVITTHYTNLKHFAEQNEGVVNGAMLYDRGALRPLFQLSIGQAGSSFAIEIARQIGLPNDIIEQATNLIGEEHIDYDRQLQDIARDKRYWENKRQNIRQREKHLEERIAYYEGEISNLKQKKREIIAEANQQASDLLSQTNATIERTIRTIKETKADKEKTKKARTEVETLKQQVETQKSAKPTKQQEAQKKVLRDLSELKFMTKSKPSASTSVVNTLRAHKLSFCRTLDLRGQRADEALEALIAYMDEAIMVGADSVTILHGTGTGALKQLTRDYLSSLNRHKVKNKFVTENKVTFSDGDPDKGGAGLTIVTIN